MSITGFLGNLLGPGEREPVTWGVLWTVDDYDGPGWYIGARARTMGGPYQSQQEAIEAIREAAEPGDKINVWDRDASEPDTITVEST